MNDDLPLRFREATLADLPQLVALLANDALGKQREQLAHPLPPAYIRAFHQIDRDPQHELMLALLEDQIVGTFQLSFLPYLTYQGGLRAQIEAVRVHPAHRGSGIGRQMIHWAIERAKARGAHLIQLTTDKQRPAAIRFYESLGFRPTHEGMKLHVQSIESP
ncbi:MAG: GNAT family N-acetyltransferase [Bacteroidetes bacterium]|nr:MAG: GNAT family N-acetyltransferase [Bacteroidota bacterium]